MKQQLLICIFLFPMIVGCAKPGPGNGGSPEASEKYYFYRGDSSLISPEYNTYLISKDDWDFNLGRYIYIYSYKDQDVNVVWSYFNGNIDDEALGEAGYESSDYKIYVTRLTLWYPVFQNPPATTSYTIYIGKYDQIYDNYTSVDQKSIMVKFINQRKFQFEYLAQPSYDVFDSRADESTDKTLIKKIQTAFSDGGTIISKAYENKNLPNIQKSIRVYTEPGSFDPTWVDLKPYTSIDYQNNNGANVYRFYTGILASLTYTSTKEVDESGLEVTNPILTGVAGYSRGGDIPDWSLIFIDNIERDTGSYYLTKEYGRVVIHELGHQRGIMSSSIDYNGTSHAKGHNGINQTICVMHNRYEYSSYGESEWLKTLDNPIFCGGHQQMLFNLNWE